jgi:hypothetical protein
MHQMRISTTQVSSVMLRSKKLEIRKQMRKLKEPKQSAMKLSQIRRRIELSITQFSKISDNYRKPKFTKIFYTFKFLEVIYQL